MVELIIWFAYWDDLIENLASDPTAAEGLRVATKVLVCQSLGLAEPTEDVVISNPLIYSFKNIAEEICSIYDEGETTSCLLTIPIR